MKYLVSIGGTLTVAILLFIGSESSLVPHLDEQVPVHPAGVAYAEEE